MNIQIVTKGIVIAITVIIFFSFMWLGLSISSHQYGERRGRGIVSKQLLEFHLTK